MIDHTENQENKIVIKYFFCILLSLSICMILYGLYKIIYLENLSINKLSISTDTVISYKCENNKHASTITLRSIEQDNSRLYIIHRIWGCSIDPVWAIGKKAEIYEFPEREHINNGHWNNYGANVWKLVIGNKVIIDFNKRVQDEKSYAMKFIVFGMAYIIMFAYIYYRDKKIEV